MAQARRAWAIPTHVTSRRLVTCVRTCIHAEGVYTRASTRVCPEGAYTCTHVHTPLKGRMYVLCTYIRATHVCRAFGPPPQEGGPKARTAKAVGPKALPPSRGRGRRPLHMYAPFGGIHVYARYLSSLRLDRYRAMGPSGPNGATPLLGAFGPLPPSGARVGFAQNHREQPNPP